jgi:hypothetical protein
MRLIGLALLGALAVSFTAASARAMMIAPNPLPVRLALSKTVVIGEVTAIEDKPVAARPFPGSPDKQDYKIAVVKVKDPILGAKGLTHVRVGFLPAPPVPPPPAGGGGVPVIRPGIRRLPRAELKVDHEYCLLLTPHFEASFEVAPGFADVIDKKGNPTFEKQVAALKHCAKLLEDPMASLKSKNPEDRFLTAAMLIGRYRTVQFVSGPAGPKQVPISADESKLILQALASADWTRNDPELQISPQRSFFQLGVTEKDGFKIPPPGPGGAQNLEGFAKAWLKAHAATYRIQRFVVGKNKPAED